MGGVLTLLKLYLYFQVTLQQIQNHRLHVPTDSAPVSGPDVFRNLSVDRRNPWNVLVKMKMSKPLDQLNNTLRIDEEHLSVSLPLQSRRVAVESICDLDPKRVKENLTQWSLQCVWSRAVNMVSMFPPFGSGTGRGQR